ncbi:TonB-dependent receptor, partial [candidate division KSB1 bacterium]|nr:TonB-dependent receptor [candidate division KSB1 bacterium]
MKFKLQTFAVVVFILTLANVLYAKESTADSVKYEFKPLVVTGQRYEVPQKEVAASISIVPPKTIRRTNFTNVADAVSFLTPGVFTTRRSTMGYGVAAMAGGSITIRGIGGKPNSQVLILIDGRPDIQGIFSHPLNDAYLMDNVDHIEILRGPASAVYGTNSLGGVINIITKKLPKKGYVTEANAHYGSYNTQKYSVRHSGVIGKLKYMGLVGYNSSDGHRDNNRFEGQNYALKLGYRMNPHFNLTFYGNVTPYEFNDPGPEGIDLYGYFDFGDITRSSMDLTLSNDFGNTSGTLKLHGNFGEHTLSDGWYSEDQTNGIIAFQNFDLNWDIKTTVGFDVKRFGGTADTNSVKIGTFFNDEVAGYFHIQKTFFKDVILATGLRLEDNSNFGKEWIPKVGLVYNIFTNTALRASASKGFRTPSVKDLFLFPPANADLQPERLWNYEFGVNQMIGNVASLDITGFYYEGDQLIETVMIAPGQMQNQNIGSNAARGFEATLKANPFRNLATSISYSYLDS